jgi:hypothetical protein
MTHTELDAALASLIERRTGPITTAARTERGYMSDYSGIIGTAEGRVFVKAMRDRPGGRLESLLREETVSPYVRHVSPPLLWRERDYGWLALGFEYLDDIRHASFKTDSADIPAVISAIDRIGRTPLPDAVRDWPENRYDRYAADGEAALFAGSALLHGDIGPDNFLMLPGGEAKVVDWAWPTRGAGFIDPSLLVVQLVSAGYTAAEAEKHASGCTAWREADPDAITAFARAMVGMYEVIEQRDPASWRKAMTRAAEEWTRHRTG